jgi:hypothetical protein
MTSSPWINWAQLVRDDGGDGGVLDGRSPTTHLQPQWERRLASIRLLILGVEKQAWVSGWKGGGCFVPGLSLPPDPFDSHVARSAL